MDTDRNLLFGVLALQSGLVDAVQFAEGCSAWAGRKDVPLADLLVQRGLLSATQRALVDQLLEMALDKHAGDAEASLATVSTERSKHLLAQVADPDVQQTLERMPQQEGAAGVSTVGYEPQGRARYQLSRLHAKGGIGQVWLARDPRLGREVALKELLPERLTNPTARARFVEEARITGQLEHPGIVPVYELAQGDDGGAAFYTMRFVRGRTLADAIRLHHRDRLAGKNDPLALRELLGSFVAVCNAVAYAHARGVLHRDLKPKNIVLGDFGEVIVLDWGLAKVTGQNVQGMAGVSTFASRAADTGFSLPPLTSDAQGQTQQGDVLGTPAYMPPEQAEGRPDLVDQRSDVYSLGAILYETLTGRPPFQGEDTLAVLKRVAREQPEPPRHLVPSTPAPLEAICLRALAKEPQARYPGVRELAQDVRRWLADEPVAVYPEPLSVQARRWVGRHRTAVTGTAAAILVAIVCLGVATGLLTAANQRESNARRDATHERDEANREKERADGNLARARKAVDHYCMNVAADPRLKQIDLHTLRKQLLETAVPFYKDMVAQSSDDPALAGDQGRAYRQLGILRGELGEQAEAKADCEQAVEIFARLNQAHPAEPSYRDELGESHRSLGSSLSELGKHEQALTEYQTAAGFYELLAADYPEVARYRLAQARSRTGIGIQLSQLGRGAQVVEEGQKTVAILAALVAAHPETGAFALELARSRNALGVDLQGLNRNAESLIQHQQAVETLLPLAVAQPAERDSQYLLARSLNNAGTALNLLGRREEARTEFQKGVDLQEKLAAAYPGLPLYRLEVARSRNSLGHLLHGLGRLEEARAEFQKAVEVQEQLAAGYPSIPEYRFELARSRNNVGAMLTALGRREEALAELLKALQLFEKLIGEFPKVPDYALRLAMAGGNYAQLLSEAGKADESMIWFDKSLTSFRAELVRQPRSAFAKMCLRAFSAAKSQALTRIGRHAEAATLAASLVDDKDLDGEALYTLASTFAACAAVTSLDPAQRSRHAEQALSLLGRAAAAGYFKEPALLKQLQTDPILDPLRQRDDFKKLLRQLEKNGTEKKE
jgi:serine/threonine-protein kinase